MRGGASKGNPRSGKTSSRVSADVAGQDVTVVRAGHRPTNPAMLSMTWLRVEDLAEIFGLQRQTIYNRLSTVPETLPQASYPLGTRGPRWCPAVVREWQAQFNPVGLLDRPRRRGRPTKAEEIARRNAQAALS